MKPIVMGLVVGFLHAASCAFAASVDVEAIAARNTAAVLIIDGTRTDTGAPVQGSGCCIHPDGYILATAHQAEGVENFTGRLADGTTVALTLIESRPEVEFALFKASEPLSAHVPPGDASELKNGAPLVSIASPINLEFSTVTGTVSNSNKVYDGYAVMLVSLTAFHGSSGGPVFDRDGRLVGLISGGLSDIDFTIVNKINNAYNLLDRHGLRVAAVADPYPEAEMLVPVPGLSEAEINAIEAYNRGVIAPDLHEKIDAYTLATKLLPAFYEAHFNLAVAETQAGDIEAAVAHYKQAGALDPDALAVKRNLGRLYLRAQQYEEAVGVFQAALKLAPEDAQSHNDLGEAYRRGARPSEAIPHFLAALELRGAPGVHYNLALAYASAAQPAKAIEHFEAYLAMSPGAADTDAVRRWITQLRPSP